MVTASLVGLIRQRRGETGLCGRRAETASVRAKIAHGSKRLSDPGVATWRKATPTLAPKGAFGCPFHTSRRISSQKIVDMLTGGYVSGYSFGNAQWSLCTGIT